MLLVITGAGASYDSVYGTKAFDEFRPPLANHLFAGPEHQRRTMAAYKLGSVANEIEGSLLADPARGIEAVLDTYAERASDPATREQVRRLTWRTLVDLRYYIKLVVSTTVSRWWDLTGQQTHYMNLVSHVEWSRQEKDEVLWVTFNYDKLLDYALEGVGKTYSNMNGYIDGPHKLLKLHGSTNWGRAVDVAIRGNDEAAVRHALAEELTAGARPLTNHFGKWTTDRDQGLVWVPAIAVPLTVKDEFECPEEHVQTLRDRLSRVDRVLAIGWKGGEATFVELLKHLLARDVPFDVVTRSNPEKTVENLLAGGVSAAYGTMTGGLSQFMKAASRGNGLPGHDMFDTA